MRTPTPLTFVFVALTSFVACGGAATPAPAADAGSPLTTICANLQRFGCGGTMCEQEIRATFDSVPARCGAQRDAYFACAARSTTTGCLSRDATFAMCAAQSDALSRCTGPIDAGRPADPPVHPDVPEVPDAGVTDDTPAPEDTSTPDDAPAPDDASAPTCPDITGRFEATGGGRFATVCPSGTFTLTRSTAGGAACRYDLSFTSSGTDPFVMSAAHVDVGADLALTGEATVADGDGTRMGQLTGGLVEMGQAGVLSINRGGDECGWNFSRLP
jgi:hypothetical protein